MSEAWRRHAIDAYPEDIVTLARGIGRYLDLHGIFKAGDDRSFGLRSSKDKFRHYFLCGIPVAEIGANYLRISLISSIRRGTPAYNEYTLTAKEKEIGGISLLLSPWVEHYSANGAMGFGVDAIDAMVADLTDFHDSLYTRPQPAVSAPKDDYNGEA